MAPHSGHHPERRIRRDGPVRAADDPRPGSPRSRQRNARPAPGTLLAEPPRPVVRGIGAGELAARDLGSLLEPARTVEVGEFQRALTGRRRVRVEEVDEGGDTVQDRAEGRCRRRWGPGPGRAARRPRRRSRTAGAGAVPCVGTVRTGPVAAALGGIELALPAGLVVSSAAYALPMRRIRATG
ncbi:hypothetical protein ACWDBD_20555 [Streptomyces sp. NPDC001118]